MRIQYLFAAQSGTIVCFLLGLALVFFGLHPIEGDVFQIFKPFYVYIAIWVLGLVCWMLFFSNNNRKLIPLVVVVLASSILLPLGTALGHTSQRLRYDAARYHHPVILKTLLFLRGTNKAQINDALVDAALGRNTDIVEYLLLRGADPNARLSDNDTVLIIAAQQNSADMTRLLLRSGAEINARNKDGMSAIMWAAIKNSLDSAKVLIASGADVKVRNSRGESASDIARQFHFDEMEQLLLKASPR